jgi:hypothetical protein
MTVSVLSSISSYPSRFGGALQIIQRSHTGTVAYWLAWSHLQASFNPSLSNCISFLNAEFASEHHQTWIREATIKDIKMHIYKICIYL